MTKKQKKQQKIYDKVKNEKITPLHVFSKDFST